MLEIYGRIPPLVEAVVEGLGPDELVARPSPDANPIAWLVWHLTRVQDHHISEVMDEPQVWESSEWARRVGLGPDPSNTGYGHSPADVARVRPDSADVLVEYHLAVWGRTRGYLAELGVTELDRVVDRRWDPPVTLGVRLVSVADDSLQHLGQAAYARGLLGL